MDIELFCPSRGRPDAASALRESFERTVSGSSVKLIFLCDTDDETVVRYPQEELIVGPPTGDPTGPLNREAIRSKADAVGFIGDDSRFETSGWDVLVVQSLGSGPGFVWGDDGHDIPWPSAVFVSREIVQALGYLALPTLRRGYFDTVWMALAGGHQDTRWGGWVWPPGNCAKILADVMFRHDNSNGNVSPAVIEQDQHAFYDWFNGGGFRADRRKVQAVVNAKFFPSAV